MRLVNYEITSCTAQSRSYRDSLKTVHTDEIRWRQEVHNLRNKLYTRPTSPVGHEYWHPRDLGSDNGIVRTRICIWIISLAKSRRGCLPIDIICLAISSSDHNCRTKDTWKLSAKWLRLWITSNVKYYNIIIATLRLSDHHLSGHTILGRSLENMRSEELWDRMKN